MAFAMVQSSWTKVRDFIPRSRYTTSMEGLTWRQAFTMPLPPYLSPIPVIFRMMGGSQIHYTRMLILIELENNSLRCHHSCYRVNRSRYWWLSRLETLFTTHLEHINSWYSNVSFDFIVIMKQHDDMDSTQLKQTQTNGQT